MGSDALSEEITALLRDGISSLEELEVLLLTHRAQDVFWTSDSVAEELKCPVSEAQAALDRLSRRGLLQPDHKGQTETFRYGPSAPELGDVVSRLVASWNENPLEVMKVMNANAIERVRTGAMKLFADSFRLGGKRKDG